MQYSIRHLSVFSYDASIAASHMEVRMRPRSETQQHCYSFELTVSPHAQVFTYLDSLQNAIHHFNIPGKHDEIRLEAHAFVDVHPPPSVPEALPLTAWDQLDEQLETGPQLSMLLPSAFAKPSAALEAFIEEMGISRKEDPLTTLTQLNTLLYDGFAYSPKSTHVHSPIDDALAARSGVCQDFAHLFITLARQLGIPSRYVSGYLYHRPDANEHERSAEDGSHAWVESFLPELGWVGFDPTNNSRAGDRHIRVALGRDYADVPPTRGVYRGDARSMLQVGVQVRQTRFPMKEEQLPEMALVQQGGDLDMDPEKMVQVQQQQ